MTKANWSRVVPVLALLITCPGFKAWKGCSGEILKWRNEGGPVVPYAIDEASIRSLDGDPGTFEDRMRAIRKAAEAWNNVQSSDFAFVDSGNQDTGGIAFGSYWNCEVPFLNLRPPGTVFVANRAHQSVSGALAVTYVYDCDGSSIRGFDLEIHTENVVGSNPQAPIPGLHWKVGRQLVVKTYRVP